MKTWQEASKLSVSEIQKLSEHKLYDVLTTPKIVKQTLWRNDLYSGTVDDKERPHGIGVYTWGGTIFEGQWKHGSKHGFIRDTFCEAIYHDQYNSGKRTSSKLIKR